MSDVISSCVDGRLCVLYTQLCFCLFHMFWFILTVLLSLKKRLILCRMNLTWLRHNSRPRHLSFFFSFLAVTSLFCSANTTSSVSIAFKFCLIKAHIHKKKNLIYNQKHQVKVACESWTSSRGINAKTCKSLGYLQVAPECFSGSRMFLQIPQQIKW